MVDKCSYRKCGEKIIVGRDEIVTDDGDNFHYDCYVNLKRKRMSKLERKNAAGDITKREALEYDDITQLVTGMEKRKELHGSRRNTQALDTCPSLGGSYFFKDEGGAPKYLDGSVSLKLPERKPLTRLQYVEGCRKMLDSVTTPSIESEKLGELSAQLIKALPPGKPRNAQEEWRSLRQLVKEMGDENLRLHFEQEYDRARGIAPGMGITALTGETKEEGD